MKKPPTSFTTLKTLYGSLLLLCLGVLPGYSQLLTNVNFDADTVGNPPSVGTVSGAGANSSVLVIDQPQNYAGTGRGIQLFDNSTSLGPQYRVNFVPNSGSVVPAVRCDFSIAPLTVTATLGSFSQMGIMDFNHSAAAASNLLATVRLYENGSLRLYVGNNSLAYTTNLTLNTGYDLSLFVNNSTVGTVNYTGPDSSLRVLPTYSVHYWMNGALVATGGLNTVTAPRAGLGTVGFSSATAGTNINYALDDIVVTQLPVSLPVTATWSGAGADDNWSTINNWFGGQPLTNDVFFLNDDATGGSGPFGTANNIVDASLSIKTLTYGNTSGFHTTEIPSGTSLTVDGSGANLFVGTGTDNGGSQTVYATMLGQGSLLLTNPAAVISVIQGSGAANGARATLDLEGLDTFSAYVNQIRVAAENGHSTTSPQFNRPNGTLILAKTNSISCMGTPGLRLSRTQSNGGQAIVKLGQENTILSNSGIEVGGRKSGNSQLIFNPSFVSPTALFRDLAGTGRQAQWTIADYIENPASSGIATTATADFTGGTVDALVGTIYVGRAGGGTTTGILTFNAGIIDVNTLYLGLDISLPDKGTGTVNVNGTGLLRVNGDLVMGSIFTNASTTHGVLNIGGVSGGAAVISGNVVCAGGLGNIITSFGDLSFGGQVGADGGATNTPLQTLELWSGSLTVARGSAGLSATPLVQVTNLNVNGSISLVVSGNNFALGQFPLFKYYSGLGDVGGFSGFNGLALTLPGNVDGYLSNNTANASVDLVITNVSTKVWSGIVNGNWDINATTNWLKVPPGSPTTYQEPSVPGDAVTFNDSATGTTTVNLTTVLSPDGAKVTNVTKSYTFTGTGALSGPAGLIKQGAGTLILANSGVNDFTGPVLIEDGTVRLSGSANRVPTNGTVTLSDVTGATFDLNGLNQTLAALNGGGTVGGNVSLGAGTLTVNGDGGIHAGVISGTGTVVKTGAGTVPGTQVLAGPNDYSGGTVVEYGTLVVANETGSGTGSGSLSVTSTNAVLSIGNGGASGSVAVGIITNDGTVRIARSDDVVFTNTLVGLGVLQIQCSNTVVIPGNNSHSGGSTITRGKVRIGTAGALGTGIVNAGNGAPAVLQLSNNVNVANALNVQSKPGASGEVPNIENISGTNTLSGTLQLTANGGIGWVFDATAGRLVVASSMITPTNTTQSSQRPLLLRGDATGEWVGGIVDPVGGTTNLALRKLGLGTWTLSGANTYTGPTVVSNGTLVVNGTIANSSSVTIHGGTLAGTGFIAAPVTVNSGGNLAPGDGSIGKLSLFSSLTLNGTTTVDLAKVGPSVTNDQVSVLTTLTLGGTLDVSLTGTVSGGEVFQLFTAGTFAGSFGTVNLPALPGGLTWDDSNLASNGTLAISGGSAPTLNVSSSGGVLTFAWTEAGYKLQAQTNALNTGLSTNWGDYPGGGTSPVNVTNNPANPAVFFRLISQ